MRYVLAALATVVLLLVGCEDHRARPAPTAAATATLTAQPIVTPATGITPTPTATVRSRAVVTPDGPVQAWVSPPPSGVPIVDAAIADIMQGDAAAIVRRITGGLYPCRERSFGSGQMVVCPAGVAIGTPVPARLVGGGCESDWINLEPTHTVAADRLAAAELLLVTGFRSPPRDGRIYTLVFVDPSRPEHVLIVELDDRGIVGDRGSVWGSGSCETSVSRVFTYGGVDYLIPRAP